MRPYFPPLGSAKPPAPFLEALKETRRIENDKDLFDTFRHCEVNIPLIKLIKNIPSGSIHPIFGSIGIGSTGFNCLSKSKFYRAGRSTFAKSNIRKTIIQFYVCEPFEVKYFVMNV